jgi:hypothetical protein
MKTKIEIEGYEIEIKFDGGVLSVKAEKDDETIEEFEIEVDAQVQSEEGEEGDEIKGFDDFEEGEDFEELGGQAQAQRGQAQFEDEDMDGEDTEDMDEEPKGTLESFQSFINRKRKR